jgi:GAF domain-containing protein
MRRPYYRKQKFVKSAFNQQPNKLSELRERILNLSFVAACVVGTVALITNLAADIPRGAWGIIILYTLVYLGLIVLTFVKKLPYMLRAIGFETILFILGVAATLTDGISGNARVWFLGFIAFGSIFLSGSGIYALMLATLTYLGIGGLMAANVIKTPAVASLPKPGIFMDWAISGVVFVSVAVIFIITLSIIVRNLNTSLDKERKLLDEIDKDRGELDKRAVELSRRLAQIRTAADISRSVNAVLDPTVLLQQVVDIVRQRFDLYYVGIFLLDERQEYAVLQAGTGEAGKKMVDNEYKLSVGGASMIGWSIAHGQPRISLDTSDETVRYNNPFLPKTRSEVALPLQSGELVFGAISLQASKPKAFNDDDVTILQGIANSLAAAIQNARLSQQAQKHIEEIQALHRQYVLDTWTRAAVNPDLSSFTYSNETESTVSESASQVNVPIALRDQVIGKVSLELASSNLSADDRAFIEQITNQAALAMENVRLLEETQRRANHERLVSEIVKKARISADVDTIIRTTLEELGKSMQAVEGVIHLGAAENMIISRTERSDQ